MAETIQASRLQHHRWTTSSVVPTVPTTEDVTSSDFLSTDIKRGEIAINMADDKIWFRSASGIVEIATTAVIANTWQVVSGNLVTHSSLTNPNVLPETDATQDLGSTSKRWNNLFINDAIDVPTVLTIQAPTRTTIASDQLTFHGTGGSYTGSELQTIQSGIDTVDGATEVIATINTASGENLWIEVNLISRDSTNGSKTIGGSLYGVFLNNGSLVQIGSTTSNIKNNFGAGTAAFNISGSDLEVTVTGPGGGLTMYWVASIRYGKVLTNS